MKRIYVIIIVFSALHSYAQQNITINQQNVADLISFTFKYDQFKDGKIVYKNNGQSHAKLNYNYYFDEVLFITKTGDTLALANPEVTDFITIGTDTFFFSKTGYFEKITHFGLGNLTKKQTLEFNGKQLQGGYGTYTDVSAVSAIGDYSSSQVSMGIYNELNLHNIGVEENLKYQLKPTYFFSDKFDNYFPATKKNVYKLYPAFEKELSEFLKSKSFDFNNEKDLIRLSGYLQSLVISKH